MKFAIKLVGLDVSISGLSMAEAITTMEIYSSEGQELVITSTEDDDNDD